MRSWISRRMAVAEGIPTTAGPEARVPRETPCKSWTRHSHPTRPISGKPGTMNPLTADHQFPEANSHSPSNFWHSPIFPKGMWARGRYPWNHWLPTR